LTLPLAVITVETPQGVSRPNRRVQQEKGPVTKKEIVKQISERIGLTQLKTKEIVQQTFDAIVETLLDVGRIELRNFGVFEVKQRKARKARNPRTGQKVDVPPKNVVTFKPGKEMEERVRQMKDIPGLDDEPEPVGAEAGNGIGGRSDGVRRPRLHRPR
jgi:nucleoid DNA-binding protein